MYPAAMGFVLDGIKGERAPFFFSLQGFCFFSDDVTGAAPLLTIC
jgi:hypothetical protein